MAVHSRYGVGPMPEEECSSDAGGGLSMALSMASVDASGLSMALSMQIGAGMLCPNLDLLSDDEEEEEVK